MGLHTRSTGSGQAERWLPCSASWQPATVNSGTWTSHVFSFQDGSAFDEPAPNLIGNRCIIGSKDEPAAKWKPHARDGVVLCICSANRAEPGVACARLTKGLMRPVPEGAGSARVASHEDDAAVFLCANSGQPMSCQPSGHNASQSCQRAGMQEDSQSTVGGKPGGWIAATPPAWQSGGQAGGGS